MIYVMVKEEYGRLVIDDLVDLLIIFFADNDLEKFLEQLESKILKSETEKHNCGQKFQNHRQQNRPPMK
jgi:hypothetical protein